MDFNVIILIRAEQEIDETIFYYENLQIGLGNKFILDYESQLRTLYSFPFFEIKYNKIRTLRLKKFPYTIHFSGDEIEKIVSIQAVTCDYQDPHATKIKV